MNLCPICSRELHAYTCSSCARSFSATELHSIEKSVILSAVAYNRKQVVIHSNARDDLLVRALFRRSDRTLLSDRRVWIIRNIRTYHYIPCIRTALQGLEMQSVMWETV